jgi:hypothetical protein
MPGEGRRLTSGKLLKKARIKGLAMSLETPDKIRRLQRKLYVKAKAEPDLIASRPMQSALRPRPPMHLALASYLR